MTPIEQASYADSFLLLLLRAALDSRRNQLAFEAVVFAGGVEQERFRLEPGPANDAAARSKLRSLLPRFVNPPHVVCLCGSGAEQLLNESAPDHAPLLQLLDLPRTAALLAEEKATLSASGLARTYQLPFVDDLPIASTENDEPLLWACLARAGAQGLDWSSLLNLVADRTSRPDFVRTRFTEESVRGMTEQPGVYVMRDESDTVLYVGKAANLARRLADYFRATTQLPEKLRAIRTRIHSLDMHVVGSELEALLLEQALITDLDPDLNRKREVAERAGSYGAPITPRLVLTPSTETTKRELFFLLPDQDLVQLTVRTAKPATTRIRALVRYAQALANHPIRGKGIRHWERIGCELAQRHLAAHPGQYHWIELSREASAATLADDIVQSLIILDDGDIAPGEIRPSAGSD